MTPFYRELVGFGWMFAFCLALIVLPWVAHQLRLWLNDESEG